MHDEVEHLPLNVICGDAAVKYMHIIYLNVLRLMVSHLFITVEPYVTELEFANMFAPVIEKLVVKCVNETYSSLPELEAHYGIDRTVHL